MMTQTINVKQNILRIINPYRGGVSEFANAVTLSMLRSESRSDALPATMMNFSGLRTHDSLHAHSVF